MGNDSAPPSDQRPILTVDLDGVICRPPFGVNLGIRNDALDPQNSPPSALVLPRWIGERIDSLRFDFRRPLPEAREGLRALSKLRQIVVLTGRRSSPERWLRRHELSKFVDRIVINRGQNASAHFKLRCVRELGASEHIDDDGQTVQLLANQSSARVYLRDWPRNRDLHNPNDVTRVTDIQELAEHLMTNTK